MDGAEKQYEYDQRKQVQYGLLLLEIARNKVENIDIDDDNKKAEVNEVPDHDEPYGVVILIYQDQKKVQEQPEAEMQKAA